MRLHIAPYGGGWKVEEEVSPDGRYIRHPESYDNEGAAMAAAIAFAFRKAPKYKEDVHITIIRENRIRENRSKP